MTIELCAVSASHVRFDLVADGRLYLGAAVQGSGGILREREARRAIARLEKKIERGERVRIYTRLGAATYSYTDAKDVRVLAAFAQGVES